MLLVFNVIFFLLFFDKLLAEATSNSDSSADAGKTVFICPGIGLYSDTSDCHRYHQCGIEGEPPISSTSCPTEMNFDTLERECRPVSKANCELCEKDGFFVDKSSPYTYIQCTGGMGEVARCLPAGTIFNFEAQACETDPNGQAVKGAYDYYPGVNNFGYDFHPIFYPYQEQLRRQHKWSPHLQNFISKGSVKAESQAKAGPVNGLASSQTKTNYNTALAHSQTFIGEPNGNETKPNEPFLGELGTMGGEYSTVHAMATATGTGKAREEEALPVPNEDEDGDDILDPEEKEAALQAQEEENAAADPSVARPQDPVYKVPSNEQEEEDGPVGPADIIAGPGAGSRSVSQGAALPAFGSATGSRGLGGSPSKTKSKSRSAGGSKKQQSRSMAARLPTFGATSGSRSMGGGSPASSKPRTRSLGGIPAEVIEEIEVEEVDPTAGNSTDGTPKTRKVKKKVKKHIPAVPYPTEVNSNDVVSPSDGANRYDEKVRPLLAKPWKYATTNAGGPLAPRLTETGDEEDEAAEIHGSWVDGGDSSLPLSKPIDSNLNDEVDATGQEKIYIIKKNGGSRIISQPIKIGAGAKKAETNQKVQEEQVEQTQTAGVKERYEILMNDGHAIAEKPRDGSQVYKYYGPIQIVHVTKDGKRETVATLDEHTGDAHSSGGSGKNKNPDLDDSGNFIKVVVSNLHGKRRVAPPKSVTKKSFPLGAKGPDSVLPVTSDDQVPSNANADSEGRPVDVKEIIPDTGHTNGTRAVGGGSSSSGDHGGSSPNVEAQASALAYRGNTKHGADPDSGRRPTPRPTLGPLVKPRSGGGGGSGGGTGSTNTYRNNNAAKESQNNWDLGWNQRSGSKYDFPGGGGNNLNMQFAGSGGNNLNNQKTSGGGSNLNNQNARGGGSNLNNQRTSGGGSNLNNQNARGGGSNLNNQRTSGGGSNLNIQNANGGGSNLNNQNAGGGGGDYQGEGGNFHQRAGGRGGRRGRRRRPGAGGRRGGRRRRPQGGQNPDQPQGEHDPNAPKSGDPFAFNWAGDTHNQERFNDTALFPFSHTFDHDSAVQEGLNYDWKTGKEYGGEEHGQVPVSYEKSFGNSQSSAYKTHLTENKNENTTFTAGKSETADTEQEYAQEKKNGSTKSMKKDKSKKGEQTASTHLGQDGEHRVVAIGKSEHDEKTNVSELDDHTGESRSKLHEKKLEHRNETDLRRDKEGTVKFGSLDKLTGYERLNDTFLGDERHEAESVDKKISSEKKSALEKNDTSERKLESEKIASTDAQALFKNISGVEFHKGSSKSLTMDASSNLEADGDDVRAFMNNNTYSTDTESLKNKTEDEELAIAHQRVRGGEANKAFVAINGSKKLDDYSTIIGSDTSSKTNKSGDREQISSVQTQMVGHTDRQGEEEANPDGTVRSKFATQNDNDASQKTLVVERVNKEDGTPDTEKITQTKKTKTNTGNSEVKTVADVDSNTSQSVKATSGNSSQTSEGSEKFHILSDQGRRSEAEARKRVLHLPPEDPNEKPDRLPSEGVDPNAPPVTEGPDEDSEEHNAAGASAPGAGSAPNHGAGGASQSQGPGSDDDYYDDYYDTPLPGGQGGQGGSNLNNQNAHGGNGGSASNQNQQNIVESNGNSGTSGNSNGNIAISIYQNSGTTGGGGGGGAPQKEGSPNVVVYKDGSRNSAPGSAQNVAVYKDGKPVQPTVSQTVGSKGPSSGGGVAGGSAGGAGADEEYYDDEYYDDDEPDANRSGASGAMGSSLPPKDPKELKPAGSQFWTPEENAEWVRGKQEKKKKKKKKKPGKGRPKVSKLKPKKESKIKYDDDGAGAAGFAVSGNREGAPSAYAASYSKGKNTKSGSSAAAGNGGAKAVAVAKRIRTSKGNSTAPA